MLPAYAGMIRMSYTKNARIAGAPRVCGDDPGFEVYGSLAVVCSPRMRG